MRAEEDTGATGYRPADAAAVVGVPASTLRLYSVRFAPLLSESAAHPVGAGGGRPGARVYSEHDVAILKDGKRLLEQGRTYEEALRELRRRWAPRAIRRAEPAVVQSEEKAASLPEEAEAAQGAPTLAAEPTAPARDEAWSAIVRNLIASLGSAQAVGEEWRRIVEERNAEIAALREQLRLAEERGRPWWRRLFGG
jgi:DNA-binding transcriptional MerR regulator